ncbi:YggT family protein [Oleispira antarctica]|uniref:YggT family protein n=1 Tax=Oleispira antarctica TaxID=188908 RepID=A0A1Y5HSL1_OLEAN|nr:YggT family protein [Oleispira antarctica]
MTPLTQAGMLIINTLVGLYLLLVVLRFLLQLVRADFYNPISQFIVKATNPPLMPLRKVIPGWGGVDISSLVLALLVQAIAIVLILLLNGIQPPVQVAIWAGIGIISLLLKIFFWGLLITVIASWIAPNSYNPALILINQILEPAIKPIRKILPDMGGIDISPIIAFLLIQVLEILLVKSLVQASGMPSGLVMGI